MCVEVLMGGSTLKRRRFEFSEREYAHFTAKKGRLRVTVYERRMIGRRRRARRLRGQTRTGPTLADLADPALVAGGAEMATLAGESDELFVTVVGALQRGESGGEVDAAAELFEHCDGIAAQRAVGPAAVGFVFGGEIGPRVVDDLPERRGRR